MKTETYGVAHKIKLNPTPEQARYFWLAAKVARDTWNWALHWYNEGVPFNVLKLEFNRLRSEEGFMPWTNEVTTYAHQRAFTDLQSAITRYFDFKKRGELKPPKDWKPRKDGKSFGWPCFKSVHRSKPSFYIANTSIKIDGHSIQFDKKRCGWINMAEQPRYDGKLMGGRIS